MWNFVRYLLQLSIILTFNKELKMKNLIYVPMVRGNYVPTARFSIKLTDRRRKRPDLRRD